MTQIPAGFISLRHFCPGLIITASYATTENFTGVKIPGYLATEAYLAEATAIALKEAQIKAQAMG